MMTPTTQLQQEARGDGDGGGGSGVAGAEEEVLELHEVDEEESEAAVQNLRRTQDSPWWAKAALGKLQDAGLPELCKVRGLETIFCEAAKQGRVDAMQMLLDTFPGAINPGCMQQAALRESARFGHLACVRLLLDLGADPNLSGALRFAAVQGHAEVCRLLLASHVNFDEYSLGGALRLASEEGHLECVKLLLAHGADPSTMYSRACQRAAMQGHAAVVAVLLEDPRTDIPASRVEDVFRKACVNGWTDVVRVLLRRSKLCPSSSIFSATHGAPLDSDCILELLRSKALQRRLVATARIFQSLSSSSFSSSADDTDDIQHARAASVEAMALTRGLQRVYLRNLVRPARHETAALGSVFGHMSSRVSAHLAARIVALGFADDLLVSFEVALKSWGKTPEQTEMNQVKTAATKMRAVVIGGSYAGLMACRALEPLGVDVTLVERNEYFFHKIGGTRACVKPGYENEAILPLNQALKRPGSRLVHGSALKVDPADNKVKVELANGEQETIDYDNLILAMGLKHGYGQLPERILSKDDMLKYMTSEQERLADAAAVVVVGGGALGVETSTQIKATHPDKEVHLYHSRDKFLSAAKPPIADETSNAVLEKMDQYGVKLHLGGGRLSEEEIAKKHPGAVIIPTAGCQPSETTLSMLPSEWLQPGTGEVKVLPTMQVDGAPSNVYAVGDLAASGDFKQAKWAKDHVQVVAKNIMGEKAEYDPSRPIPWWSLPYSLAKYPYVRARTSSPTMINMYIGETDSVTQAWGILFNDKFTPNVNHPDKGASKAKMFVGMLDGKKEGKKKSKL
ncbi:Ankyrin repeat domain-containing protein 2 [Hondaea fermentalgiana]|uniref:Ankyrin repeat domain-containing protein 2 n=1 Tax=Hondaea fermentalgiana TaxID=2315210 RepID=A0A2R5G2A8_9STRA|nr:Ankyrin repeat domain-containing protein 2 [Hondaea fermentalgiana]|eukprot:GBG23858.1 Ankyrin repeat domain-containing protein 2 [Hondaea fermentalgiana]